MMFDKLQTDVYPHLNLRLRCVEIGKFYDGVTVLCLETDEVEWLVTKLGTLALKNWMSPLGHISRSISLTDAGTVVDDFGTHKCFKLRTWYLHRTSEFIIYESETQELVRLLNEALNEYEKWKRQQQEMISLNRLFEKTNLVQ